MGFSMDVGVPVGRTVRKTGAAVCQYDLFCDRDQLRIFYDGTWCVGSRKFSQ